MTENRLTHQRVEEIFPREIWSVLPGGVPYYMVIDLVSEESISP